MDIKRVDQDFAVSGQIAPIEIAEIAAAGFGTVICNRPDGEGADQPVYEEIRQAADRLGLKTVYLPVVSGMVRDEDASAFAEAFEDAAKPVFAYCRTGTRSITLWALARAGVLPMTDILQKAKNAGYDMSGIAGRVLNNGQVDLDHPVAAHDIVIVGGGAAGIATASSLLARDRDLDIAVIEPSDIHYYQPGWTLVGGGVFDPLTTRRDMAAVLPGKVHWIKAAVAAFHPDSDTVLIEGCRPVRYKRLIVCPGLKLDWNAVDGLVETLGRNGVTSNYRYDLAPYTWELVKSLKGGKAVFTQPPMPIKCAGAPQKAMYLSADHWFRSGTLKDVDISFCNAGGVLFGVADYVPALMQYVDKYGIDLDFNENLIAVDGERKIARFRRNGGKENAEEIERPFDMLHVCPPQIAPDFIRVSPLADAAGWVDVDKTTLRHTRHENVFALGDVTNTPNAKTAAAARKQAPVVADNVIASLNGADLASAYDGYGSCPLTVERGKIVLAEFLYGGKLAPSFPAWLIDGTRPTRTAWWLKERILPPVYWQAMLKGREWMAKPEIIN